MTATAFGATPPAAGGTRAAVSLTEQTVADIAEVLRWYGLQPHAADRAAREVLAAINLADTAPAHDHPAPLPALPPTPTPTPTPTHSQQSTPGTALAVAPSLIDVDFAGLTLPDPTASTARAWVKDRYGELMVDDGVRYRTPAEAEADGRHLVAIGQTDHGLALIAAARRTNELTAARRRRRRWPFGALKRT
jgi:hypothetical protein